VQGISQQERGVVATLIETSRNGSNPATVSATQRTPDRKDAAVAACSCCIRIADKMAYLPNQLVMYTDVYFASDIAVVTTCAAIACD